MEIEDKPFVRVTDEQAQKIIYNYSKRNSVSVFQKLKCGVFMERPVTGEEIIKITEYNILGKLPDPF